MRASNGVTSLSRRRRAGDPMDSYDRLPADLRRWLADAALPWSPCSALRLWRRLARENGGDRGLMLSRLTEIEARNLSRDRLSVARLATKSPAPGL